MDFKQLEAFAYVVQLGSFSRAAERLYLTQPTVSAHISSLEKELGCQLVIRGSKGAEATEVGRVLYDYSLEMLALRQNALSACKRRQADLSGVIHIAASTVTYQYVLPRAMSRFRALHGGVSFDIRGCDSGGVVREIAAGRAEIGMTGAVMGEDKCLFHEFMEDELVVITPPGEPFASMEPGGFTLAELTHHPFILREAGSGTRKETESWLHGQGLSVESLKVAALMEEPDAIKNAVSQGLGISIISRLAVTDFERLGLVRIFSLGGQAIRRKLYIVRHRRRALSPEAAAFMDFVRREYSDQAQ